MEQRPPRQQLSTVPSVQPTPSSKPNRFNAPAIGDFLKFLLFLELRRFAVPFRSSDHWTRFRYQSLFDDLFLPDFERFFDGLHHVIPCRLVKDWHEVLLLRLGHGVREPRFVPVLNSFLLQDSPNEVW